VRHLSDAPGAFVVTVFPIAVSPIIFSVPDTRFMFIVTTVTRHAMAEIGDWRSSSQCVSWDSLRTLQSKASFVELKT
jgi:hypothetical protein